MRADPEPIGGVPYHVSQHAIIVVHARAPHLAHLFEMKRTVMGSLRQSWYALRARRLTSAGSAAKAARNLGFVAEFIDRSRPALGNVLLQLAQQRIERAGFGIGFDLAVPLAIAFGIKPACQFSKLPRRKGGNGLFDFGN